jgi:hypothetical protein
MISHDEDNHLSYCHEELLRLAREGHGRTIHRILHESSLAEIRTYRDVSLAVTAHMGSILHWHRAKSLLLRLGVHAVYAYERFGGRRRMVTLAVPERRDAMGGPAPARSEAV